MTSISLEAGWDSRDGNMAILVSVSNPFEFGCHILHVVANHCDGAVSGRTAAVAAAAAVTAAAAVAAAAASRRRRRRRRRCLTSVRFLAREKLR